MHVFATTTLLIFISLTVYANELMQRPQLNMTTPSPTKPSRGNQRRRVDGPGKHYSIFMSKKQFRVKLTRYPVCNCSSVLPTPSNCSRIIPKCPVQPHTSKTHISDLLTAMTFLLCLMIALQSTLFVLPCLIRRWSQTPTPPNQV